jgi:hypothetical protein
MRLYIINSTELIPAAQKQVRILDFAPMESKVAMNVMGSGPEGKEVLLRSKEGVGDYAYAILFDKAIHASVSPGPQLDAMNRSSVEIVARSVEELASRSPARLKLFEWVKKEITFATTESVYGPQNPFRNPKLQDAYW